MTASQPVSQRNGSFGSWRSSSSSGGGGGSSSGVLLVATCASAACCLLLQWACCCCMVLGAGPGLGLFVYYFRFAPVAAGLLLHPSLLAHVVVVVGGVAARLARNLRASPLPFLSQPCTQVQPFRTDVLITARPLPHIN